MTERIAVALVILALLIVTLVQASRGTSAQRCESRYPNGSALQRERCVTLLTRGGPRP